MAWAKPIVNVSHMERIAAGALAAVLLASAIRGRKPLRLLAVALLVYRATTGNCKGYELFGPGTCPVPPRS